MNTKDIPFSERSEKDQNDQLARVAYLLRPMLGEIGEALIIDDGAKKAGFIGLLCPHTTDKVILFAEFIDEEARISYRTSVKPHEVAPHVRPITDTDLYVRALTVAAGKPGLQQSNPLSLVALPIDVQRVFEVLKSKGTPSSGNIIVQTLRLGMNSDETGLKSAVFLLFREDSTFLLKEQQTCALQGLIGQLIRNAIGLAGISDLELCPAATYLLASIPGTFNDYAVPQSLAAIYASVREVVPAPLPTGEEPVLRPSVAWHDAALSEQMKCIHTAQRIAVKRPVGGSLKGASVYSIEVHSHEVHGTPAPSYPAIAKFSTVREARAEANGLRLMQRYYSKIGKHLPPPLQVYLCTDDKGKPTIDPKEGDWLSAECISVTPDLEGHVLSEKIMKHWGSPTRRVERFTGYLKQARHFIDEIQKPPLELVTFPKSHAAPSSTNNAFKEPKDHLLDWFANLSSQEKDRFSMVTKALLISNDIHGGVQVVDVKEDVQCVNPIWWINEMLKATPGIKWCKHDAREARRVLTHGDFHTGNLFFSHADEHLTVLDYDHVGVGDPESDLALLETSFATFVFDLKDFRVTANWEQFAPTTLALLAECHPFSTDALHKQAFARDLSETLSVLRPENWCPFYVASLVRSLANQVKATYTKWDKPTKSYKLVETASLTSQGRNAAALLYMAFLLTHLVEPANNTISRFPAFHSWAIPKT